MFAASADTAGLTSAEETAGVVASSTDAVFVIALQTADLSEASANALEVVTRRPVAIAPGEDALSERFVAVAQKVRGLGAATYVLAYCSPKRANSHVAKVEFAALPTEQAAELTFDAAGFGPGCVTPVFAAGCDGRQCGGLGCGACDDRTSACDVNTLKCENYCLGPPLRCDGESFTNPHGYEQTCNDASVASTCGDAACHALATDTAHCGTCGNACPAGGSCNAGTCACPAEQTQCGSACVSLGTTANCTTCGDVCATGASCATGSCQCPSRVLRNGA